MLSPNRMLTIFTSMLFMSSCSGPHGFETLSMHHPANPLAVEAPPPARLKVLEEKTFNEPSSTTDEKEEHDEHGAKFTKEIPRE